MSLFYKPTADSGSAIPDSAVAQYDAQALSLSDGDSVTTWSDELGNFDLSGGSPTYRESEINTHEAVVFDAIDDLLTNTNVSVNPPFTVFAVFVDNHAGQAQGGYENTLYGSDNVPATYLDRGGNWEMDGDNGNVINIGSSPSGPHVLTNYWDDGPNSEFRVDGTTEVSGDTNTQTFDGLGLGNNVNGSVAYGDISVGEFVVCGAELSASDRDAEEQRLADKWGVTI